MAVTIETTAGLRPASTPDCHESGYRPPGRILALIPAHNEAQSIAHTIHSLRQQTMPPDEITVICDNCTDDTDGVSMLSGARVFKTTGNTSKKAGALNQALRVSLAYLADDDLVLTIDADSNLNPDWIRNAWLELRRSTHARRAGAVCGIVKGENGHGLIGQLQRNEYIRAVRAIARMRRIWVLSGCGTIFRAAALRKVSSERGVTLPGQFGDCFNTASITEDYEMTLALRVLGFECLCSIDSVATTELMPKWRDLFRQRLRWQRGSLGDIRSFGIMRATWLDWSKQAFVHISYAVLILCWAVNLGELITRTPFNLRWGLGALLVYLTESVWTVRKAGHRGMILALWILPEFGYAMFRSLYLASALKAQFMRRSEVWSHVERNIP
ncbi:MAG TPA: glycosyltransferase family 2 protein [Streptosporangiaceae bacterium]|nr:glycosyltransferase family 2 protein [Streptosporangiaceae bacterium]